MKGKVVVTGGRESVQTELNSALSLVGELVEEGYEVLIERDTHGTNPKECVVSWGYVMSVEL